MGDCPKCGSSDTQDCDADPDIQSNLVARCVHCGTCWCVLCEALLDKNNPNCPCWEEDDDELEELDARG